MVFCLECEALYSHLGDLNNICFDVNCSDSSRPRFKCPQCSFEFAYLFPQDGYPVTREQWIEAGFAHLLVEMAD